MKLSNLLLLALAASLMLTACSVPQNGNNESLSDAVEIVLDDNGIKVDGTLASTDTRSDVYIANDIIYYESGKDFTYGEGDDSDAHSAEDAAKHTVVHITKPGTYSLSGTLSAGQIAVDLGETAEKNPESVVTLLLNGVDISCSVAPAVIFYNVYECSSSDTENATKEVDTSSAGANVIVADGSHNVVNGSYVARIYKPGTVELNEDGTKVEDAKKLHKYDAAFYSKMSMNINGGSKNTGVLEINAQNEGLDSELHLTINGGIINITSGNDGINTNEDGVSVTTLNGGELNIKVNGKTGEGDGIDSNGWLVINGGKLTSEACGFSMDGGIDSDMGIHINGGTVIASGNMLDRISESNATYAVFNFSKFPGSGKYVLKNSENKVIVEEDIENSFTSLVIASPELAEGDYTLWYNDTQLKGAVSENGGFGRGFGGGFGGGFSGGMRPDMGARPEGVNPPENFNGRQQRPENMPLPENFDGGNKGERPEGFGANMPGRPEGFEGNMPERPEGFGGNKGERPEGFPDNFRENFGAQPDEKFASEFGMSMPSQAIELSEIFPIKNGANYFSLVGITEEFL